MTRASRPTAAPLPEGVLDAWLSQSHDLLALTDETGRIRWCNAAFERATGVGANGNLWGLTTSRESMPTGLEAETHAAELELRSASGSTVWVDARVSRIGHERLWTLHDITEQRELATRAQRLSELLDMAQEFGRLGVWEREIPSGSGRWDRHVFGFWGLEPEGGTPDHSRAKACVHPDDQSNDYLESTRRAGRYAHRYRVVRADGSVRRIHSQWEVKNSAHGVPDRTIGIMVDDTEVYELARSRDDTAAQLRLATELADIVIWRHDLGTGRVHYNDHGFKVLGIAHRADGLLLDEARALTHPDDVVKLADSAAHALETGVPIDVEVRHRRSDGVWRHMLVRRVVERDPAGKVIAFLGVTLDVTERHVALDALHAATERAALIARHAGIGTWESDGHGLPAMWDAQMWRLRGMPPRAVPPGREDGLAIVHPDDRAHVGEANSVVDDNPRASAYEFRIRLPDGTVRWLASRSAALQDESGKVGRRVGVNWDITEAKSAQIVRQQALLAERENAAKSLFLSRMSHELRTPLNAILGFTQLLQLEGDRSNVQDRSAKLDHIRAAGEHLLTLIDDALDLTSLQSGNLKLELRPVLLAEAVKQAMPLVEALAATHGVTLRCGRVDGTVRADPTRLRQVILNLLTNAIKYNRAGGEVVVESAVDRALDSDLDFDRVRLGIRDTGLGLQPGQLAHLFEPFNRLGMEALGIEGSGIGLTIVKALVEGMGGGVAVSSEPGHGTMFEVSLPRAERSVGEPSTAPAAPDAAANAVRRERSGRLLYIEDNTVNVLLVEELVTSIVGLQIVSEGTGTSGVARARAMRPDLILIDIQLPDFDGFEVLRRLRAHPATAMIPCIALSANAMPDDIARALAAGFDDYWTKPIKFKPFLDALERRFPV